MAVLELMACKFARTASFQTAPALPTNLSEQEMCKLQTCSIQREEQQIEAVVKLVDYDDDEE